MSRLHKGDPTTPEYWDKRVKTCLAQGDSDQDLLFRDHRYDEFTRRVEAVLGALRESTQAQTVLDVACGFGRFAHCFDPDSYLGVDFSVEMLKLAEERSKGTEYRFMLWDARNEPDLQYDIIFEVNSLLSLGLTAEEFITKYKPYAKKAVAVLEADFTYISQLYPDQA